MAITEQDVFEAASALVAAGKQPTQTGVREHLGGGSYATIGPALKVWKDQQAEAQALQAIELPAELDALISMLGGKVWQLAMNTAEGRTAAERTSYDEARQQLTAELAESREAVIALESELADSTESLDLYRTQLSDAEMKIVALEQAQTAASAAAASAAAVYEERVKQMEQRLEDAHKLIDRLSSNQDR